MNRRAFLAATALGLARPAPGVQAMDPGPPPFLSSDVGPLRRVIVHEPGPETRKALTVAGVDHPLQSIELLGEEAVSQHRALVSRLKQAGAEVLEFKDLLQSAIDEARRAGEFAAWLESAAPLIADREAEIDAAALIGAVDELVYHTPPGSEHPRPLTPPLKFLLYVRDLAVMTPHGLILANLGNRNRQFEVSLLRFALHWGPELRAYPVAFDATREQALLQGGDVIVADDRTLLVGVGNLTEEAAARKLAQRLGMEVVAVQLPSGAGFRAEGPFGRGNGLRLKFVHLDSILSLTGPQSALVVPYFLEAAYAGKDPLTRMLRGLSEEPGVDGAYMGRLIESLAEVGRVRVFKARTGEADRSVRGLKLVDLLRRRGYRITHVGGDPPERHRTKHVVEQVLREVRFQGGNLVATAPGRLIACDDNPATLAALRRDGFEVATFPADEIVRWHGGAHCLTLPLERLPS